MPRFVVERTFGDGLRIPIDAEGARACLSIVDTNTEYDVTWVHSYVSADRTVSFCVYDGPNPSAIRQAGQANGMPVDRVTEVAVLDPYFYR
jgi:hypothetical protein